MRMKSIRTLLLLLVTASPHAQADPLVVTAEPSACAAVDGGVLVADDELVGSVYFCDQGAPPSVCRVAKLKRDNAGAVDGEPPSKLVPLQDIEGLGGSGKKVFLIGSHQGSDKRRKDREFLLEAKWKADDDELEIKRAQYGLFERLVAALQTHLAPDDPLRATTPDPSRLNIEGITTCGDDLFLGLRSPRDPQGRALLLRAKLDDWFAAEPSPEVLAVDLGGAGVRALDCSGPNLIVLSGPESDAPGPATTLWAYQPGKAPVPAPDEVQALLRPKCGEKLAAEGVCSLGGAKWMAVAEAEGSEGATVLSFSWSPS